MIRRHVELALCHLAQHGKQSYPTEEFWIHSLCFPQTTLLVSPVLFVFSEINAKDMISGGALWELIRISRDCSRDDIRSLARRTLTSSPTFQAEMRRLRIEL